MTTMTTAAAPPSLVARLTQLDEGAFRGEREFQGGAGPAPAARRDRP